MDISDRLRPRFFPSVVFKLRGLLMAPLIVVMAFSLSWEYEGDTLNWGLGLPFFLLGWWLRLASQRHLKYRLRLAAPQLATAGPYTFTRNPVYVGNVAMLVGLSILCEVYWFAPIAATWAALVYHVAVVGFEEVRLRKMFRNAYEAYRERVPRWLPSFAARAAFAPFQPAGLKAALRAEWQCGTLLIIPLMKELFIDGVLLHKAG